MWKAGYENERSWKGRVFGQRKEPTDWDEQVLHLNRPVVNVSWYEVAAYCAGQVCDCRRRRSGSAQHGASTAGSIPGETKNANDHPVKPGRTTPVGMCPRGATADSIEDLAGNTLEWVADSYQEDYYSNPSDRNPKGHECGEERVLRVARGVLLRRTYAPPAAAGSVLASGATSVSSFVASGKYLRARGARD